MLALVEAVERGQHRLQRRSLGFERHRDGQLLLIGMRVKLGPPPTLRLQPPVELLEAGEPQPRLEEPPPDRLHLVLDLALLPPRCRRASGRLNHVVVGHDQEAAVEHPLLAGEHRGHRGLHVVVDAARRNSAEEGERAGMRVEHHLLRLARIGPNIHRPRCAQPHVRGLHPHRLAGDLDVLVAPVELVGLARPEDQRDERCGTVAGTLAPLLEPAGGIAADRVVGDRQGFP